MPMTNFEIFRSLICSAIFLFASVYSQEAHVSQVRNHDSGQTIEDMAHTSKHVVVVAGGLPKQVVVKEVIFPKETHAKKADKTIYREYADVYEIVEVVKSPNLKVGTVRAWLNPSYGEELTKIYHETGETESPENLVYRSKSAIAVDEKKILFLGEFGKSEETKYAPDVVPLNGIEAIRSLDQVKSALASGSQSQWPDHVPAAKKK
jgi:hypothetical protein